MGAVFLIFLFFPYELLMHMFMLVFAMVVYKLMIIIQFPLDYM